MWKTKEESLELIQEFIDFLDISPNGRRATSFSSTLTMFINWLYKTKKWEFVNKHQQPHDVDKFYRE